MTFISGRDKIMDQSLPEFSQVLAVLAQLGKYDNIWNLRLQLVGEQIEMASEYDDAERRIRRIRGEQWKLEMELRKLEGDDKLAHLFVEFWRGGGYA